VADAAIWGAEVRGGGQIIRHACHGCQPRPPTPPPARRQQAERKSERRRICPPHQSASSRQARGQLAAAAAAVVLYLTHPIAGAEAEAAGGAPVGRTLADAASRRAVRRASTDRSVYNPRRQGPGSAVYLPARRPRERRVQYVPAAAAGATLR